jgi:hypothetical protein
MRGGNLRGTEFMSQVSLSDSNSRVHAAALLHGQRGDLREKMT